jgi:hypothetical protein
MTLVRGSGLGEYQHEFNADTFPGASLKVRDAAFTIIDMNYVNNNGLQEPVDKHLKKR